MMSNIVVSTITEAIESHDGLDILLKEVNKYASGFRYSQRKTLDGEVLLCITFQEETINKLGELQFIISDFLKVYQCPTRFVVEADITEKERKYLVRYFYNYLITRNQDHHLVFNKKSKY